MIFNLPNVLLQCSNVGLVLVDLVVPAPYALNQVVVWLLGLIQERCGTGQLGRGKYMQRI